MPLTRDEALAIIRRGEGYLHHKDGTIYTAENAHQLPDEADFALATDDPESRAAAAEAAAAKLRAELEEKQAQLDRLMAATGAPARPAPAVSVGPQPVAQPAGSVGPQPVGQPQAQAAPAEDQPLDANGRPLQGAALQAWQRRRAEAQGQGQV